MPATQRLGKTSLVNRIRLKERFIEDTGGTSVRGRHMVRVAVPLDQKRQWALVLYDELFVKLNSVTNSPQSGFDRNRVFIGINRQLGRFVNLEAGYLNNVVNRKSPAPDRMNHVIQVTVNVNLNSGRPD